MKKVLTFLTMALLAISANAQEVCVFNPDNTLGLDEENGTDLVAGTVIGETDNIVATIGADDAYKPLPYTFTVNGVPITGGLQGSYNPRDADEGIPATTLHAPVSGTFLVFEAKADGWLYVMQHAISSKAYSVFEEGTAIGYTFAAIGDASTDLGAVYQFTLVGEGEYNEIKNPIEWAEREFLKNSDPEKYAAYTSNDTRIGRNGHGVIKFPVFKDCKYIVNANGSKIRAAGYVFSKEENVTISFDDVTIIGEGGSAPTFDIWTVAGDMALLGFEWDASSDSNNMITFNGEDYSLTKYNLTLPKGSYEYKIFKNHSTQDSYPTSNATLVIDENATYTVKFTFKTNTKELSATATKTDGLYFNYIKKGKKAELIQNPNKYKGTVIIPSTVTHEGEEYTVTKIADYAFSECGGLTSVTIPNSVTSIGYGAFSGCSGLSSVTIPNSVTSIGENAFSFCSSLSSVTIPNSVTFIGNSAFGFCNNLNSVHISDLKAWCKISFGNAGSNPLCCAHHLYLNGEEIKNLVIPNSISEIGAHAFNYCTGLTSIIIPNSVTSIGYEAFSGCSGLTSVTISNSVTSIDIYAFQGCSGLSSVTIPNSVTSIGIYAFEGCSNLTSVTIGSGVKKIGGQAFANCEELTDVYCMAEELRSEEWSGEGLFTDLNAFQDSYPQFMTLHVPAASIEAYRSTEPWCNFKAIVPLENGEIPVIQKCATPEISYENGMVKFTCETEGVEYISSVTLADEHSYYDDEIQLSQKYKISVYATKTGYYNSDTTTREIEIKGDNKPIVVGDVDGDGKVNVADHVKLSDIIMNK